MPGLNSNCTSPAVDSAKQTLVFDEGDNALSPSLTIQSHVSFVHTVKADNTCELQPSTHRGAKQTQLHSPGEDIKSQNSEEGSEEEIEVFLQTSNNSHQECNSGNMVVGKDSKDQGPQEQQEVTNQDISRMLQENHKVTLEKMTSVETQLKSLREANTALEKRLSNVETVNTATQETIVELEKKVEKKVDD